MNEPDEVQILEQLQKIVSSNGFVGSPRKREFLRYIVEKTLGGQADSLKAYAIGVDVFERGEQFDPQGDTIVRVQASNLRKSLDQYYLTDGRTDSVRIDIPKGKYIPRFAWAESQKLDKNTATDLIPKNHEGEKPQSIQTPDVAQPLSGQGWRHKSIFLGLFIAGFGLLFWLSNSVWNSNVKADNEFDLAAQMPMGPTVAILPFQVISTSEDDADLLRAASLKAGLQYELIDKISRFKNIMVVELKTDPRKSPDETPKFAPTQYLLSGYIQDSNGQLRITSILSKISNGEVLATRTYDKEILSSASLLEVQHSIAVDVAASLGQSSHQIHSRFVAEQSKLTDMHAEHYHCLMRYYGYLNRKTETEHDEIRDCLESATDEMPMFSSGWAALSGIYADEFFIRYNPQGREKLPLERALDAARRGVEADSENAMAYQYLAMARFWAGDDAGFLASAATALSLNPNDAEVLAVIGNYLIRMDRPEQGKALVEKSMLLNPSHSIWDHRSLVMYHYMRNESEKALFHARKLIQNDSPVAHVLYVVALVQNGQFTEATAAYRILTEKYPNFPLEYQTFFDNRRLPTGFDQKVVDDLVIAGLTPLL